MEASSFPVDEHEYYPIHEEDHVPEGPLHFNQMVYLKQAFELRFPEWRVESDHCMYWVPGNTRLYRAADGMVVEAPRRTPPLNVYLAWRDSPLRFVVEVASPRTRDTDLADKLDIYENHLLAGEYLFVDHERGQVRLWRRVGDRLREVPADPNLRWWSAQLGLWFQFDGNGFLRCFTGDGAPILTHEEQVQRAAQQQERAEAEAQRADAEAQRARAEADARAEAERRLAEVLAELDRLRASAQSR